jgi:hypothetical protein
MFSFLAATAPQCRLPAGNLDPKHQAARVASEIAAASLADLTAQRLERELRLAGEASRASLKTPDQRSRDNVGRE